MSVWAHTALPPTRLGRTPVATVSMEIVVEQVRDALEAAR